MARRRKTHAVVTEDIKLAHTVTCDSLSEFTQVQASEENKERLDAAFPRVM